MHHMHTTSHPISCCDLHLQVDLQVALPGQQEPWQAYGGLAAFGGSPNAANYSEFTPLAMAAPLDACAPLQELHGGCTRLPRHRLVSLDA